MPDTQMQPKKARKPVELTDSDVAKKNFESYERARDMGHLDYIDDAKKFDRYYRGDQWEEDVVRYLDAQNRPHQTINLVLSTVNAVIGEIINQKQEIHFKPAGDGATEDTAFILNKVVDVIESDNKSPRIERDMALDGLIEERGFVDIRMDFTKSISGDIRETLLDPRSVIPDAFAREYDPATWNEVHVTRWMTPDQIEALYGHEKAEKLRYKSAGDTLGIDSIEWLENTYGDLTANYYASTWYGTQDEGSYKEIARIRVIERQYRKLVEAWYFVDIETGDTKEVPQGWTKEKRETFAETFGLALLSKPERRIRWTVSADDVLLHDDWSPYSRFTVIPFFPYFRRGKPFGLVRNIISPQDMLNKVSSQELHVVNTSANSGWIFQSGSLVNMDAQDLEDQGAKTGLVLEYMQGTDKPEKIQPNQVPTGLDHIATKNVHYFREISGVSNAMLGQSGQEVSGVALENRQQRGLVQMEVVFDNLARTRELRAEFMLELIQQFYNETRIFTIATTDDEGREIYENVPVNAPGPGEQLINDLSLGKYKVRISSVPVRDTVDETEFSQMLELRQAGVLIPDWAIIENSNLHGKREIAEHIRRLQGAAEPTPEELARMQLMQEIELQTMLANLEELRAKARERLAHAVELEAKAQNLVGQPQLEMARIGAEMRRDQEKILADLQQNRDDILARLQISREKNQSNRDVAKIESLTRRIDTMTKGRYDLAKADLTAKTRQEKASPASKGRSSK